MARWVHTVAMVAMLGLPIGVGSARAAEAAAPGVVLTWPDTPDGVQLNVSVHPELPQVFVFVRFEDGRGGRAELALHNGDGEFVTSLAAELRAGSALFVWDRTANENAAAAGTYEARFRTPDQAMTVNLELP